MVRDFITFGTIVRIIINWFSVTFIKGGIVNIDCFIILRSRKFWLIKVLMFELILEFSKKKIYYRHVSVIPALNKQLKFEGVS